MMGEVVVVVQTRVQRERRQSERICAKRLVYKGVVQLLQNACAKPLVKIFFPLFFL